MKSKLITICLILTLFLDASAQSPVCFSIPDGIDGSGWSYKDYIIPAGYRVDSVYMDATRPGYPTNDFDFVFQSCAGTTIYSPGIVTYPFDYSTDPNSEYNVWIDLTSFNYVSIGMVRVCLPTNAGAIWNEVCFAISPTSTTNIASSAANDLIAISPNPVTEHLYLHGAKNNMTVEIFNELGQKVKLFENLSNVIDVSDLPKGLYLLRIDCPNNNSVITKRFIKL